MGADESGCRLVYCGCIGGYVIDLEDMAEIAFSVRKSDVWDEVAKTTAYIGDKLVVVEGGNDAYERVLMTDANRDDLQRFWEEAAAHANVRLREMLLRADPPGGDYGVVLDVSDAYERALDGSVLNSLRSYFVLAIVARWCGFADRDDAEGFAGEADALLEDVRRKLYTRRRPRRPGRE